MGTRIGPLGFFLICHGIIKNRTFGYLVPVYISSGWLLDSEFAI